MGPVLDCSDDVLKKLSGIRILSCDVDGVLTDGGMYFGKDGLELLRFHVQDGTGLKLVRALGIRLCFISQSNNPIIKRRAEVLGIDFCHLGVEDKSVVMRDLCVMLDIPLSEVCHIADDVNDLTLLKSVGVPVTVANGVQAVRDVCCHVTSKSGGDGAVRELCELILRARAGS